MHILACEGSWIKEDTEIEKLRELRDRLEKKKEYKDRIFSLFLLEYYTDNRVNSLENKFNYGVEMRGDNDE